MENIMDFLKKISLPLITHPGLTDLLHNALHLLHIKVFLLKNYPGDKGCNPKNCFLGVNPFKSHWTLF